MIQAPHTLGLAELVSCLTRWDELYYDKATQEVDDSVYDDYAKAYQTLTGTKWQKAGSVGDIPHVRLMGTQDKVHTPEEVMKWVADPETMLVQEPKIDGLGLEISYTADAAFWRCLSRGKRSGGVSYGENVTDRRMNLDHCIPMMLKAEVNGGTVYPAHPVTVRGEVYLPTYNFERANELRARDGDDPFSNCRNAAAGIFRKNDPEYMALLRFVAYGAFATNRLPHEDEMFRHEADMLEWLKLHRFEALPYRLVLAGTVTHEGLKSWRDGLGLPYDTDGVVLKINDWAIQRSMGYSNEFARFSRAYKFEDKLVDAVIGSFVPRATRTGRIAFRYKLATPVEVDGAMVEYATANNWTFMQTLGALPGDTVKLRRSNGVIPKVEYVHVVDDTRPVHVTFETFKPTECPTCAGPLTANKVDLLCENTACGAKLALGIENACNKKNLDVDCMGEALAEAIAGSGAIFDLLDFFKLVENPERAISWMSQLSTGEKRVGVSTATKIVNGLKASQKKPYDIVLHSLGCPDLGEPQCREIAQRYDLTTLVAHANVSPDLLEKSLAELPGFGKITAATVLKWLKATGWLIDFSRLGWNVTQIAPPPTKSGKWAGKTFLLTGTFQVPKHIIEKEITDHGGEIAGSVSKKLDYLLVGTKAGSKLDKAHAVNAKAKDPDDMVTILDEAAWKVFAAQPK